MKTLIIAGRIHTLKLLIQKNCGSLTLSKLAEIQKAERLHDN